MQQAILTTRVEVDRLQAKSAEPAPRQRQKTAAPHGEGRTTGIIFLAVVLLHAALVFMLITHTTEYKPLELVTPAENVAIQANIVEPPPEPVAETTPEPPVLTVDQGEREVVQTEKMAAQEKKAAPLEAPTPPPQPVKREIRETPPKPVVKRQPPPPKAPEQLPTAQRATPSPEPSTATTEQIAGGGGRMLQNSSGALPKNIAAVGCAVPEPAYPRRARRLQQEGEVLIRLVISPEGRLIKHDIARSSGYQTLDQAAMDAVANTRCTPYRENGQAITVMTLQPVNFKLSR